MYVTAYYLLFSMITIIMCNIESESVVNVLFA